MRVSQEFRFGIELIRRFEKQLKGIVRAKDKSEMKPLVESIKHPIFGAMAQIKSGDGPLKEEILGSLAVVVSQFRELSDPEALKGAVEKVLRLIDKAEEISQTEGE